MTLEKTSGIGMGEKGLENRGLSLASLEEIWRGKGKIRDSDEAKQGLGPFVCERISVHFCLGRDKPVSACPYEPETNEAQGEKQQLSGPDADLTREHRK